MWFDKVIAKIKRVQFFAPQYRNLPHPRGRGWCLSLQRPNRSSGLCGMTDVDFLRTTSLLIKTLRQTST